MKKARHPQVLLGGLGPVPRPTAGKQPRPPVEFAHASERVFAALLDFYGIAWQYEPRSFALSIDESGGVTEAFTPDFYLPGDDLYVELTTMSQKLVTRKNRKLRMLRERYPDVRCRIFYQRDVYRLATKHGLDIPAVTLGEGADA